VAQSQASLTMLAVALQPGKGRYRIKVAHEHEDVRSVCRLFVGWLNEADRRNGVSDGGVAASSTDSGFRD
jgi:hypothetical protein